MHHGMTTRLRPALRAAASVVAFGLMLSAEAESRRRRIRELEGRLERLEDELSLAVARNALIEGELRRALVDLS